MAELKSRYFSLSSAATLIVAATAPGSAIACGEDAYVGQICLIAGDYCPRNTVEAAGQVANISTNSALFALIGRTYGGDCRTTMAYLDFRGRVCRWGLDKGRD